MVHVLRAARPRSAGRLGGTHARERRILAEGETLSQHAVISAQRAMDMAGLDASSLDLILLATSSPDDLFGSACEVPQRCRLPPQPAAHTRAEQAIPALQLGARRAARLTLLASCS